jgi:glycosyltransferase involved in cell wall biosynthesis
MKRVLIITYYWPPSGGGGVMRWLKFVRYFREYGWEPVVYTPENPEMPAVDQSLSEQIPKDLEIVKRPVWEPYTLYKKFTGQKKDRRINTGFLAENETPGLTEELSVWIRGNFFIPDARKYWIKPSIKFLKKYLLENPVDAVVSTGPPHSMHLIALGIKKKFDLPWIADFRDPWTNIDFYPKLKLTRWADRKHRKLEMKVLREADRVVTVSWNWAEDFKRIYSREVDVITNGFDAADFSGSPGSNKPDSKFSLVHIGAMNADRNPDVLWTVLGEMCRDNKTFKEQLEIKLIGSNDISVTSSLEKNGLMGNASIVSYLPHAEVIHQTRTAQVLLLPLNDTPNVLGIIPGKLYEYLASCRPILCLGPRNGDSSRIIKEAKSGTVLSFDDAPGMAEVLLAWFSEYSETGSVENKAGNIDQFSRKKLTSKMAAILESIT